MIGYNYLTADQRVCDRKITLHRLHIRPKKNNKGVVIVRNGPTGSAEVVDTIRSCETASCDVSYAPGLPLDRGLYIDIDADVESVLVMWEKED